MTPGSCSTGIHILMEELELIFEVYVVNLVAGDQYEADFMTLNPRSTIPVLVTSDGTAISDFGAIAYWLARQYPKSNLLPANLRDDTRVIGLMNYVVGTIHQHGFTRFFTAENYVFQHSDIDRVKAQGLGIVKKGLALMNRELASSTYLADTFSIADAALFYCEFWSVRSGVNLPQHCKRHYQQMLQRPAVRRVMTEEGYGSLYRAA